MDTFPGTSVVLFTAISGILSDTCPGTFEEYLLGVEQGVVGMVWGGVGWGEAVRGGLGHAYERFTLLTM